MTRHCSWQDESNGEIYNDRDHSAAAAAPVDPESLYVVENGKEYPLASVSKRRSFFVSQVTRNDHRVIDISGPSRSRSYFKGSFSNSLRVSLVHFDDLWPVELLKKRGGGSI